MSFNGRPRGTIESLKLHGMDKKDNKYQDYAQPDIKNDLITEIPKAPSHYSSRTKQAWNRIFNGLIHMRVLTTQDLDTLITGFDAFEDMVKAQKAIKEFDKNHRPLEDENIKHRKALSQWMLTCMTEANKVFCRYGLTPTERTRLNIIPEEKSDEDPLDVVLNN